MSTLTDIYNSISDRDAVYLEKHAAEIKVAEEQDAAGRITARGFIDELHKIAGDPAAPTIDTKSKTYKMKTTPSVKVKQPKVGVGATGGGYGIGTQSRTMRAPNVKDISKGKGQFGRGATVAPSGQIRKRPTFTPGQ